MPRFAANLSMLYPEHAFLNRFAAAAADGFEAVEYLFPYDGWVGCEYRPRGNTSAGLQWLRNWKAR